MKYIFIFIMLLLPLIGFNQSVMLGIHKSRVKLEMSYCEGYKKIINNKNYLEYQKSDTIISFKFQKLMGGWYCNEVHYKVPDSYAIELIELKELNGYWIY